MKFIKKYKFTRVVLNKNSKIYIIYIIALQALWLIIIDYYQIAQIEILQ